MSWYTKVFRQYADFQGRARRMEFWMFTLVNTIVFLGLAIPSLFLAYSTPQGEPGALVWSFALSLFLYGLAQLIPAIAVGVRRFHDQNRSGWWFLIILVPTVGGLIYWIMMMLPGTRGPNRFGPDPLHPDDEGDVWPEIA